MKRLSMGLLTLSLALVLSAGCSRESNKGGPAPDKKGGTTGTTGTGTNGHGTTGTATTGTGTTGSNERDDFTISVPRGNTNVDQGGQTNIDVSVNRHGKFDQEVTLKFDPAAGSGLKVEPATVKVPKDKNKEQVTVQADAGAKTGSTNIKVTATPTTGKAVEENIGIDVKAGSNNKSK